MTSSGDQKMFAVNRWHYFAALLVLTFTLVGCGKQADVQKVEGNPKVATKKGGDISAEDLRRAAKSAGGDLDAKQTVTPPPASLANVKPDAVFTAEQMKAAQDKDPSFLNPYANKVVEVTGIVAAFSQDYGRGEVWIKYGDGGLDRFRMPVFDKEPWLKVLPTQKVTLRTPDLIRWEIVAVQGLAPPTFTAEQFAKETTADPEGFKKQHDEKYLIITGAIAKVDENAEKEVIVELDGGGVIRSSCHFSSPSQAGVPLTSEQKKLLKPGTKVKLLGRYRTGRLVFCFLLEPTS